MGAAVIMFAMFAARTYGLPTPVDVIQQWMSSRPEWPLAIRIAALTVGAAAAILIALTVHELGHLVAGLCLGFRFGSMRVGRLHLTYPFRLSWARPVGRGATAMVTLFPVGTGQLRLRALGMLVAGPAANLIVGGTIVWLPYDKGFALGLLGVCSLFVGAINLLSFRHGTFTSDGRRIVMLLRDPSEAQRWLALLALNAELTSGVPPESLSPGFLAAAVAPRDDSFDTVAAHLLAYLSRFYQRDDAGAADALETCLSRAAHLPEMMREGLKCEAAIFQGRRRARQDLAEAWLSDIPLQAMLPGTRQQAEAAILQAKGDRVGARRTLDSVEALLRDRPDTAGRDLSLRLLRRWMSELDQG